MYYYRPPQVVLSTKPVEFKKEENSTVGTIERSYKNVFIRLVDILLKGRFFVSFIVKDKDGKVKVYAKESGYIGKRRYSIEYFVNDTKHNILIKETSILDTSRKLEFEYDGEKYKIEKQMLDWARLKKDNLIIAEWKKKAMPPFDTQFKLTDKTFEKDIYLIAGIFHTCFYLE